jgi:hypothetical protein
MVSMFVSSAVDRGFDPRRVQIKDYKIGMCCFSAKHAALRRKSKVYYFKHYHKGLRIPKIQTEDIKYSLNPGQLLIDQFRTLLLLRERVHSRSIIVSE